MDRRAFLLQSSAALLSSAVSRPAFGFDTAYESRTLSRIAFGSCNRVSRWQGYWNYVLQDRPDLWIWLGDNVYADHATAVERQATFDLLKNNAYYQAFTAVTPVIGTWDDHDYAFDNADGRFLGKDDSRSILFNFLDIDSTAAVWNHEGVYQSYEYGVDGQRTKVILLDLRWDLIKSGLAKKLMSQTQWAWLEKEIRSNTADLLIIGSSLNVSSPVALAIGLEGWAGYAEEKQRLYALLDEVKTPMIVLSGDRHMAEISRIELPSGRLIFEVMSSGLTHAIGIKLPHPGRIGEMVGLKNYGLLTVDWSGEGPAVTMQIKSAESYAVLEEYTARFDY